MENNILLYNNTLNFNLKQMMNSTSDLLYNIQSLKQLQLDIDKIQSIKDGAQLQINMACLALLRQYLLDESVVGPMLFRNLIRKYYPLSDEQVVKYENEIYTGEHRIVEKNRFTTDPREWYYITNLSVLKRKGPEFAIDNRLYRVCYKRYCTSVNCYDVIRSTSLISEISSFDDLRELCELKSLELQSLQESVFRSNYNIDFHNISQVYGDFDLAKNKFTKWDWELVSKIKNAKSDYRWLEDLLENNGFFAQMGIRNVAETLTQLQHLLGTEYVMAQSELDEVIERYEKMGIKLYSYSPNISKEFIVEHQDDLDWLVLQKNPYVQWDLELINLFLRKYEKLVPENGWYKKLDASRAMYSAIENLLNDRVLNDIEKLYEL